MIPAAAISARQPSVLSYLNPWRLARDLLAHWELIRQFTAREVLGRYKGSYLGLFWSVATPLLMLGVYTFVFTVILTGGKWGNLAPRDASPAAEAHPADFLLNMLCGLILFNIFAETISRAPTLVLSNINYVKRVVFPLHILPISVLLGNLIYGLTSLVLLLAALLYFTHGVPWTIVLFPLILIALLMLCTGLAWFLASLGVFFRDIQHAVIVVVQLLFFMTPIFYPAEMIPERYRWVLMLNPLAMLVTDARRVMIEGVLPVWSRYGIVLAISFVVMLAGYAWFMRTRRWFADVI
ncbi:MAG TPA: ABC transporter permease [Candidatus Sumerlaeota bacterium]|nr:MAG: Teichoic acid translocation permease protein TagG [candidate division BRC1 bacterium ADurb.BinA292]HOE96751.1 ABC transporter permease [Candidatus Sumerlaeota bacterium]HOR26599.1 ABC transporter permease [Candidatus Sumerlaeota bacterium]HPK00947.1 ABC transporter permease [Candidatus Sumerlaeota bacterium]